MLQFDAKSCIMIPEYPTVNSTEYIRLTMNRIKHITQSDPMAL
jgi:hypothetical protein